VQTVYDNNLHKGLLSDDLKTYSNGIDTIAAKDLVEADGRIFEAAVKDVESESSVSNYIEDVYINAKDFISNPENIYDRSVIKKGLIDAVDFTGSFLCLLGGKNCGKSLLIKDLAKRQAGKVFVIDLRKGGLILKQLLSVLESETDADIGTTILNHFLTKLAPLEVSGTPMPGAPSLKMSLKQLFESKVSEPPLEYLLNGMIEKLGKITLIIDEANIAFDTSRKPNDTAFIEEAKVALELFVRVAKQEQKVVDHGLMP
jgi:hypothetical protein